MEKSNLVFCPNCKREIKLYSKALFPQIRRPLGEIGTNGEFIISPNPGIKVVILGANFSVKCGFCGEIALERRQHGDLGDGVTRIHWEQISGTLRVEGTYSQAS